MRFPGGQLPNSQPNPVCERGRWVLWEMGAELWAATNGSGGVVALGCFGAGGVKSG